MRGRGRGGRGEGGEREGEGGEREGRGRGEGGEREGRGRGEGGEREGREGEGGDREAWRWKEMGGVGGGGKIHACVHIRFVIMRRRDTRERDDKGRGKERAKEGYKMLIGYWYDFVSLLQCLSNGEGE